MKTDGGQRYEFDYSKLDEYRRDLLLAIECAKKKYRALSKKREKLSGNFCIDNKIVGKFTANVSE